MDHRDAVSKWLGKGAGLPLRGRDASIGDLEMQEVIQIFQAQATGLALIGRREFRIESDIQTSGAVKKLAVDAQARLRPYLF